MLARHRDDLAALRAGPGEAQAEYYRSLGEMSRLGRTAANDNERRDVMGEISRMFRDIADPPRFDGPSDYRKAIEEAAARGANDNSKGRGVPER